MGRFASIASPFVQRRHWVRRLLVLALLPALAAAAPRDAARRTPPRALERLDFEDLKFRAIGPANMGGRISAIAAVEKKPGTFYVGLGTGGIMKTGNLGTTWKAIFERQRVASIGDIAVWPGRPDIVWVGTGEANSRNSSSWGNGK